MNERKEVTQWDEIISDGAFLFVCTLFTFLQARENEVKASYVDTHKQNFHFM